MNLKEKLAAKEAELKELEPQLEDGNEEIAEKANALVKEIENLKERVRQADNARRVIAEIGTSEQQEKEEDVSPMQAAHLEELKITKGTRTFPLKDASNTDTHLKPTITVTDRNVVDPRPSLGVRELFGTESINGNALTFYKLNSMLGTIGTVNENSQKGQVNIGDTAATVALIKIAAFIKESDELLSDGAFLESAIRGRLTYEFEKAVEEYLVNALTATSGVQVGQAAISFDNILKAKQAVRTETGYAADSILINPADLEALLVTKDLNNQYLLGGPAYGSYGNGAYAANPRIWGLNVVESGAVSEGQCIVGAFKAGSSVVTKAGEGRRIEVSNSDQNDFIYNRVTVRIEERMVLATRVPAAFVLVGTASSSSK